MQLKMPAKEHQITKIYWKTAQILKKKEEFSMGNRSLDDIMYDEETRRYSLAFDG